MDFCNMDDDELARVMCNYIMRMNHLLDMIDAYLEGNRNISDLDIRKEYANLKDELNCDYAYVDKMANRRGSDLYMNFFVPSIKGAAACGFMERANGRVSQKMHSAVDEAIYRMTKYYSLEEWEKI